MNNQKIMAQNPVKKKEKQIGKKKAEKKPLIDPRYKNIVWTTIILIILLIFFIINNTKDVPDKGPYPPNYKPGRIDSMLSD
jgi:hypothetical protein